MDDEAAAHDIDLVNTTFGVLAEATRTPYLVTIYQRLTGDMSRIRALRLTSGKAASSMSSSSHWVRHVLTERDSDRAATASLVGIPASTIYAKATGIAVATAAIAGTFLAIRASFDPGSGPPQLLFAFEAVVIGGLGSLWGTLVGGVVLGIAQTVGATIDPKYAILTGHLVFLLIPITPRSRALLSRRSAS